MATSEPMSTLHQILENAHQLYTTHLFPLLPSPLQSMSNVITTLVTPVIQSGDIVSLAALLLCLYLGLRIADYIRRSIMGWIWFMLKIGMVLLMIQAFFYVQTYGWQKALRDAGWIGGIVWGFVEQAMQEGGQEKGRATTMRGGGKKWNVSGGRQQVPGGGGGGRGRRANAWT